MIMIGVILLMTLKIYLSHDEYVIDNNFYNSIESGFGRVSTLGENNPTILEECQHCMHLDYEENILCDGYIIEFDYDPTWNL